MSSSILLVFPHNSRKRAQLSNRPCLVCSLVARSATNGNNTNHNTNRPCVNGLSHTRGLNKFSQTPIGYLAPGLPPSRYAEGGCGSVQSPVGISRLKRGDLGQAAAVAAASGEVGQGTRANFGGGGMVGGRQKDGVFFRPLPCMKARRCSWGGYDRRRLMRRTRFDSIPEGLAEEEDDDLDQEVPYKCVISSRYIRVCCVRGFGEQNAQPRLTANQSGYEACRFCQKTPASRTKNEKTPMRSPFSPPYHSQLSSVCSRCY